MKSLRLIFILLSLASVVVALGGTGCSSTDNNIQDGNGGGTDFLLTSVAFSNEDTIAAKYTCDGEDTSPALQWNEPPENTLSFALICDDPDAPGGTWIHWVLYNIPAASRALQEGIPLDDTLADGSRHGTNGWGVSGYGGLCPPSGTHRYYFKLYALDKVLDLAAGATSTQLVEAMEGHILAQAELMCKYTR